MNSSKSDFTQGSILGKLLPFMLPILGALVSVSYTHLIVPKKIHNIISGTDFSGVPKKVVEDFQFILCQFCFLSFVLYHATLQMHLTVLFVSFPNIPDNEIEVIQNHVAEIFIIADMGGLQHFQMWVIFARAIPFYDFMSDSIDKGVEVLNLHGGNPIHINLNVRKKLDKVLMGGKFAEQTVVDPSAFQKCNHFIVQMQLRQWRVDLLPVLCPAQQIIDRNPIEVCQRDKVAMIDLDVYKRQVLENIKMTKDEYLITDPPLKALTVFAMPMILGSFFQQVYNMACLLYTSRCV